MVCPQTSAARHAGNQQSVSEVRHLDFIYNLNADDASLRGAVWEQDLHE